MTTQTAAAAAIEAPIAQDFYVGDVIQMIGSGQIGIVVAELGELGKMALQPVKGSAEAGFTLDVGGPFSLVDWEGEAQKLGQIKDAIAPQKSREIRTSQVILAQIQNADRRALFAWGASKPGDLVAMTIEHDGEKMPGLMMRVRNHRVMADGKVFIGLAGNDTYTVLIYDIADMRTGNLSPFASSDLVHDENMIEVIDHHLKQRR